MVIYGFTSPVVALFYILAVGLLSYHLVHGADSMFQSMGWRSEKWAGKLRAIVIVLCVAYFLGNLAIPAAVQLRKISPHPAAPEAHLTVR
jgi:succinate dehydrogenase / fumarate reductase cytochrome b subunit